MLDGTSRFRKGATSLHHYLQVAGYATHSVLPEVSVIPIRKDVPLDVACLVSCGVLAGAGPVFNRAKVPPGASVAVWGCGGVGLNTIQAARLVDKIVRGTPPGEIPIEMDNRIHLAVNLKVARAIGLRVSPEMLVRANRVIE